MSEKIPDEIQEIGTKPTKEIMDTLIELGAIVTKNDYYEYSPDFVKSAKQLKRKGVGRLQGARLGRRAGSQLSSIMVTYKAFRNQRNVENLITAFTCLDYYLKSKKKSTDNMDTLSFGIWYLNDHKLEVIK
jgi:ribosomal protein L19E